MSKLVDHALKQAEGLPGRLDNIERQEVTVNSVRWSSGGFGPYCVMEVITPEGELVEIMTSGMLVMDALEHAEQEGALPCTATFNRVGRTWTIA